MVHVYTATCIYLVVFFLSLPIGEANSENLECNKNLMATGVVFPILKISGVLMWIFQQYNIYSSLLCPFSYLAVSFFYLKQTIGILYAIKWPIQPFGSVS